MTPATSRLAALQVPTGWVLEPFGISDDLLLLLSPSRYMATLDFRDGRGFRLGLRFDGPLARAGLKRVLYRGRGWQQRLVDDAVAALSVIDDRRST